MKDELNPNYIFQTTETKLLAQLLKDKADMQYYLRKELAARGLDGSGLWVGFKRAKIIHRIITN